MIIIEMMIAMMIMTLITLDDNCQQNHWRDVSLYSGVFNVFRGDWCPSGGVVEVA